MSFLTAFIILLMLILMGYMVYRFMVKSSIGDLACICLQVFTLTITIFSFIKNTSFNSLVELIIILFGFIIPGNFLIRDYFSVYKKIKEKGIIKSYFDSQPFNKKNKFEESPKLKLNSAGEPLSSLEIISGVRINGDSIILNLKKIIENTENFIKNDNLDDACREYEKIISILGAQPTLYYNYGCILYKKSDFVSALDKFEKCRELIKTLKDEMSEVISISGIHEVDVANLNKLNGLCTFNLANSNLMCGNYEKARELYEETLLIQPDMSYAYENYCRALIYSGKESEGLNKLKKMVEDSQNYKGYFKFGSVLNEIGRSDEAKSALIKSIELNGEYAPSHAMLGNIYANEEKYSKAADLLKKACELDKTNINYYYRLGMCSYAIGNKEEAVRAFKKVLDVKPDSYKAYYNIGITLDELNDKNGSIRALKKAVELKPDFIDAQNNLGIVLSSIGRYSEAIDVYINAIKASPDSYILYYNMGLTLSQMRRYSQAVDAYNQALKLNPEASEIYQYLADALNALKNYEDSVNYYNEAAKLQPEDGELFYKLAMGYAFINKYDLAFDSLKKAIKLNKDLKYSASVEKAFSGMKNKSEFKQLVS